MLTVASLIEAEAASDKARPLIASVIYNRLADHMMLQFDTTTQYATGNFTKPLTVSRSSTRSSPYNTHTHFGLPPTPIDSPGLASIEAAAHPARTHYLYFFAKPCSNQTVFATSYAQFQHLLAVDRRPPTAPMSDGGAGSASWAGRWPTAARRPSRTPRCAPPGLHGWRYQLLPVPPELFAEVVPALRAPVCRRQRHDPPQAGGAGAGRRRHRARAGDRGRQHAHLRRRRPDRAPTTPTRRRSSRRCPSPPPGGTRDGPRRRRQRPGRRLGAAGRRRGRGPGLEPHPGARPRLAAELGATAAERPVPADVLVNCTAVGLDGSDPFDRLPLRPADLTGYGCVVDLVYTRRPARCWSTAAREQGIPAVDGLELLIGQGALSFEIFTGVPASLEAMRAAVDPCGPSSSNLRRHGHRGAHRREPDLQPVPRHGPPHLRAGRGAP